MSFIEGQRSKGAVDEGLEAFVQTEAKRQQFQELVYNLTDICWDICAESSPRFGSKVDSCLVNCVERFIDTTNFITNRLEREVLHNRIEMEVQ